MNTWPGDNQQISKEFSFNNFREALTFINEVAALAEEMNHHPDIFLHDYKHVKLTLTTHSAGHVTEKDHQLAEKINNL